MRRWLASLLLLGTLAGANHASARVVRFAVLIGNDRGRQHEMPLRYAASDARRLYRVLRELGGFEPINMVLLSDEDNAAVRSTLLSINERIRETVSDPGTDALLFVYYSGHADAQSLHLGRSSFPVRELAQLVRGSAADFRLVVLDACRSGTLTRLKGGRLVEPFELPDARLPGDGLAFLTASSATEDAQESDELKSSFFTHALVTGMMGAADRDGDGAVALDEAYRYAYDATLRSTSRTLAGTQHPTFRYDFRGTGGLVLTHPAAYRAQRARLMFPAGYSFLLMHEHADGPVTAELPSFAPDRSLSVRPGRYFVRARGERVLYEGLIDAQAGASQAIMLAQLEQIPYAEPARKGVSTRAILRQAVELGARIRTALASEADPCPGLYAGYGLLVGSLGVRARLGACVSGFENRLVAANSTAFEVDLLAYHMWRADPLVATLGGGGGLSILRQRFETVGVAPNRTTAAPFVTLAAGLGLELGGGFQVMLDLAAQTHFVRTVQQNMRTRTAVTFAPRLALGLRKWFD